MTDEQFNACERIDTHEWVPGPTFYRELASELGCSSRSDVYERFKYTEMQPRDYQLSISTMCAWYRGLLDD